eukprot:112375_1
MSMESSECANCSKTNANKKCSGCKCTYYCSQQCQVNHWKSHKKECKKLRKKGVKTDKKKTIRKFEDNIRIQMERQERKQRKPRLQVGKPRNGTIKIQILNDFLIHNSRDMQFELAYKYKYNKIKTNTTTQWQTTYFDSNVLTKKGIFWLKIALKLHENEITFRIRAKYTLNLSDWFEWSKKYMLAIPSSLIDMTYTIGEVIYYRNPNEYTSSQYGTVINIFDDYHLKIMNKQTNKELIIAAERVFPKFEITNMRLVDISSQQNKWNVHQNLILHCYDENILDIYIELIEIYCENCYNGYYTGTGRDFHLIKRNSMSKLYFDTIGKFMAKHIMEFVIKPEFKWKIGCRLNHKHGLIYFDDMRSAMIRHDMQEQKTNKSANIDGQSKWCDLCYIRIEQLHCIYICGAVLTDIHDYCLNCINIMITQHDELQELLKEIFKSANHEVSNINTDCIQIMVDFIIGRVTKIPLS